MEAVGTIFVVVGILIIASITLIIDWIRVQFARQDQRTHRLEDRVDGHQAVLEKHELLHSDPKSLNGKAKGSGSG